MAQASTLAHSRWYATCPPFCLRRRATLRMVFPATYRASLRLRLGCGCARDIWLKGRRVRNRKFGVIVCRAGAPPRLICKPVSGRGWSGSGGTLCDMSLEAPASRGTRRTDVVGARSPGRVQRAGHGWSATPRSAGAWRLAAAPLRPVPDEARTGWSWPGADARRSPRCFCTVTDLLPAADAGPSRGWCEPIGCCRCASCAAMSVLMASGSARRARHAVRSCVASRCIATCMRGDERGRGADPQAARAGRFAERERGGGGGREGAGADASLRGRDGDDRGAGWRALGGR